jgi:hypothetical protein
VEELTPPDRDTPACKECDEIEVSSSVSLRHKISTETVVKDVWVKGNWHTHDDVNEYAYYYECSFGHSVVLQFTGRSCWCGWLPTEQQTAADAAEVETDMGVFTTEDYQDWK